MDLRKLMTIHYNTNNWPIFLMYMTCTSKWLFEDLIGQTLIEMVLLAGGFLMLLMQKGFKIKQASGIWLLYIFSIAVNLLISGFTVNIIGRAGILVFTTAYVLFLEYDDFDINKLYTIIFHTGVFHSFAVIGHFLLKETFNNLYYPMLHPTTAQYAYAYYRGGRFSGIVPGAPHEVAGMITFSIFIVFARFLIKKEINFKNVCLLLVMVIALFLTGKKGILAFAVITVMLMFFVLYGSRKHWQKLFAVIVAAVAAFFILRFLIIKFPDNPLFYRISVFLEKMNSGESADSGRSDLHADALMLWKDSKWFGIGWRQFKGLTTTLLGYDTAHEVNFDYLQWLCETGIVGFCLNITPVLITFKRTLYICKNCIKKMEDTEIKTYAFFAVSVQFFILMYAFMEVPFYDIMFYALYIISCIIINTIYKKTMSSDEVVARKLSMKAKAV